MNNRISLLLISIISSAGITMPLVHAKGCASAQHAVSNPYTLVKESELSKLLNDYTNVVVDFYKPWCGPCQKLLPFIEQLATKYSDTLFVKIDVDKFPGISSKYEIRGVPTLLFFKDGKKIDSMSGYQQNKITQMITNIYPQK